MPTPSSKPAPPPEPSDDSVALHRVSDLIASLQATLPARPEAVQLGMALAADPDYPPAEIIQKLAGLVVNSAGAES